MVVDNPGSSSLEVLRATEHLQPPMVLRYGVMALDLGMCHLVRGRAADAASLQPF